MPAPPAARGLAAGLALVAALAAAPRPTGADAPPAIPVGPNSIGPCPGAAITPDLVVQGQFPVDLMGAYVMLPFEVPPGTTQVRVKYCWEGGENTVDLGIWQVREGETPWGEAQFRGWGGSSHPDVAISEQGFSSEAQYLAEPKGYVPGRTTRGFLPDPIPAGTWAVELGVGAVDTAGDALADWRVEIELSSDPADAADPYVPAPYDETPANPDPGWYAGDLHVHAEHSALGDATMSEAFDYAFAPIDEGGAGLDFVSLTDYVTSSAWGEIGRYQASYPGKLILRSTEIITYHGHAGSHAAHHYVDHRIGGPIYELDPSGGTLTLLRANRTPAEAFAEIRAAGGLVQVNHPTIYPSSYPANRRLCRGCPWDFSPAETDYSLVDSIEVHNGSPLAYLFTPAAIDFYESALAAGHRIAAVAVSDSHRGGCIRLSCDATVSPIGHGATVVYAQELSEQGILDGIRAGHTYAKMFGNEGPDLRLEAAGDQGGSGIMGDALPDTAATLDATVLNLDPADPPHTLQLVGDGVVLDEVAVTGPSDGASFRAESPGHYWIQLRRPSDGFIEAMTSPVYVPEPGSAAATVAAAAVLAALARRRRSVPDLRRALADARGATPRASARPGRATPRARARAPR